MKDGTAKIDRLQLPVLLGIFFLALALRFLFLLTAAPVLWGDSFTYMTSGLSLLRTGRIPSDIVMPLYPAVLALAGPAYIRVLQCILSASTVPIVYALALHVFGSVAAARYASLLIALDPITVFYANQRLTEMLFTFLLLAALLGFYKKKYVWGSVFFVASLLVRPTLDFLGPALVPLFCFINDERLSCRRLARCTGLYCLVYIVLMTPWWLHNYKKYGRFVRLNFGDGIVLRVEHNPLFAQYGFDWGRLKPAMTEFDAVAGAQERNAMCRSAAIHYITEDKLRYLKLSLRRVGRFWSPLIDQSDPFPIPGTSHLVLRIVCFVMTVIVYLGLLRTAALHRASLIGRGLPLLAVIGCLMAAHVASHALVRYRVPLTPLLIVLSAGWLLPRNNKVRSVI